MNIRRAVYSAVAAFSLSFLLHTSSAWAAPAGSTGQCNDGTYSQSAEKKGACRGHKGVKEWFSDTSAGSQPRAKSAAGQPMSSPASSGSGSPPAGAKGQCNDGSYSSDAVKKGACRGHKGVKSWFSADAPSAAPAQQSSAPAASSPSPKQSSTNAAPMPSSQSKPSLPPPTMQQRQGGGPGQVWVNTSTKVYHCMGDRYYGKTKEGTYMSESDARAKGIRADAGKACKN